MLGTPGCRCQVCKPFCLQCPCLLHLLSPHIFTCYDSLGFTPGTSHQTCALILLLLPLPPLGCSCLLPCASWPCPLASWRSLLLLPMCFGAYGLPPFPSLPTKPSTALCVSALLFSPAYRCLIEPARSSQPGPTRTPTQAPHTRKRHMKLSRRTPCRTSSA